MDSLAPATLPINIVTLQGADVNLERDLTYANTVYGQAKVTIEVVTTLVLDSNESADILSQDDDPTTLDIGFDGLASDLPPSRYLTLEECLLVTGDHENCHANWDPGEPLPTTPPSQLLEPRISNQNISVFYVPDLKSYTVNGSTVFDAGGKWLDKLGSSDYPTLSPGVVVATDTDARTLPHELGHVFLGGDHPEGKNRNFMAWSINAMRNPDTGTWYDEMTWDQIQAIRSSSYLR